MKDYYKINEIARLYGIGVDSLRYYEKLGILKPRRDTNGYRLYNLKDMYKLNVIRDLRRLDFSMQQIKDYWKGRPWTTPWRCCARSRLWSRPKSRSCKPRPAYSKSGLPP